ncbi:peptidase S58 DmpA isoform 2 [Galdieria sulphuraria]|uniref:Peptidase S58 DmpA isoform 1 n=1 Tax=Galdieria sulphuraria TaxID=130081 RepID=M2Y524_GALSU|nr:peptidase S58 DmpA isoform 1 [Galdieria sulphuraria]XP_005707593.1 peptidase S58 DmpA isoform 2 [Galdieria sulphuraria]EME31072.1 peptidase S58 DmpA isoform 1 [Galdieria sulphuraria]EME31073.1 peptidase S58 DmpA isoform 2 [Galdieria sulphuraria]|eukprot:XP_005707592.1 peptidase S58 DmpA isoform 1 [Galdieria sulphuraria]
MRLLPGNTNSITDVEGVRVGSVEHETLLTGTTVVVPTKACTTGVSVSGGAPGSRETDALRSDCLVGLSHAVFLSGGSVFGLDAGSGVTQVLTEQGQGFNAFRPHGVPAVPIVPGCVLFDLGNGGNWKENDEFISPYQELGKKACLQALRQRPFASIRLGNVGAGTGSRAGAYKGGLGSASAIEENGQLQVGALMAVNSYGSPVIPGSDILWASFWEQNREMGGMKEQLYHSFQSKFSIPIGIVEDCKSSMTVHENTVIGVVATNAALFPAEAKRVAIMAHDGIARSIKPSHTLVDGDAIFVLATGNYSLPTFQEGNIHRARVVSLIGAIAADCVTRSIGRAMWEAKSSGMYLSYRDYFKKE